MFKLEVFMIIHHLQDCCDFSVVLALKLVRIVESIDLAESQHLLGGGCYRAAKNRDLY